MKIALCDDEPLFKDLLYAALQNYAVEYMSKPEFTFEFIYFESAQALLNAPMNYDLLFLDICLNDGCDGIEVGCSLRAKGCTALFIIMSSMDNRYKDGYRANVFRYMTKPVQTKDLKEALDAAIIDLTRIAVKVSVSFEGTTRYINRKEIVFADNYLRKRTVHTANQTFQASDTWVAITRQLEGPEFYMLRKKYLINMNHICAANRAIITMSNQETIKFTRSDRENGGTDRFFTAFHSFLGRGNT